MVRNVLLTLCISWFLATYPAHASGANLSNEERALMVQAVDASFQAARACYSVQRLVFSSVEARGRGADKEGVIAAAASRTRMLPELYAAIDLAFEVERVTDPKVDAFFASCLERTRAEIEGAVLR